MQTILRTIFSFTDTGRYFVLRRVCSQFRSLLPKIEPIHYINLLCREKQFSPFAVSSGLALEAAEKGCLNIVKRGIYTLYSQHSLEVAIRSGQLEIVKYLYTCGFVPNAKTCYLAAEKGYLEILKWLRSVRCPWDASTCDAAAFYGHLELLQWLREQDCPWDERVCESAAYCGHLHILIWARDNGCPWSKRTFTSALVRPRPLILEYLLVNQCPWSKQAYETAAFNCNVWALDWLKKNGCPLGGIHSSNIRSKEVQEWVKQNL